MHRLLPVACIILVIALSATSIPAAAAGNPAPPVAPMTYTVPPGAVNVSTSAGLITALQVLTPTDIVLKTGAYTSSVPFNNVNGHRIYSATLGGAILRAGLVMGGSSGPGRGLVQGVTFDVTDPARTLQNSIVHVWGTGAGSRVLDSYFYGHSAIGSGIMVRQPEGLIVQRVRVRDFTDFGVLVDANIQNLTLTIPVLLEDLDVANVSRPTPGSSNGTAEACVWLGNTGTLRRARVRSCAWDGLWTGTSNTGSLHTDVDIDTTPVGFYMEHFTTGATFQNMRVGPNVRTGSVCEWADPSWGSRGACLNDIIQDSTITSSDYGANLDQGTTAVTIRRVTFIGQKIAAIRDKGVGNVFYDNDYSGIAPGAVSVQH